MNLNIRPKKLKSYEPLDVAEDRILVNGQWRKMQRNVLYAAQHEDKIIVIYDYMTYPTWQQARNLVAYDLDCNELWSAEHPSSVTTDTYVNFMEGPPITVNNFAGYTCQIDPSNGKLLASEFTK